MSDLSSPALAQLSKREITPSPGVKVVFCIRNEKFRLAYFLEYYRNLGVTEFFAVDNNSDDGTTDYLLSQQDVHVFHTSASYKASNAGRNWTSELANRFCTGQWCLTLDVDEYFVYPFVESVTLPQLGDYLDKWGYQGVYSIFLDFYNRGKLSEAVYKEGTSPFDVCNYFDTAKSYNVFETPNFPFLQIKGGIRQRKFWDASDPRSGPSMRKLVMVKWNDDFEYLHSTHSCSAIRLADITGVVAHFKFLSHFKEFSQKEVERNDRVANSADWKVYADALEEDDVVFFDNDLSVHYTSSQSLQQDGHLSCSLRYFDHVHTGRNNWGLGRQNLDHDKKVHDREALVKTSETSRIDYSSLNQIWGGIGLFSQTFGSSAKGAQDMFRIEEEVDALVNSQLWKFTYPLRKFGEKFGLCDKRSLPEEMPNQSTFVRFKYTFGSVWYDLIAPLRLLRRIFRKLFKF